MNTYNIYSEEEDSNILALHGLVSSSYIGEKRYKVVLQAYGSDAALVEYGMSIPRAKRKLLLSLKASLWWHCKGLDKLKNA